MLRKGLIRGAVNVPLSTVSKGRVECEGREGGKDWGLVFGSLWRKMERFL
jgi:hypothetical protein